MIGIYSRKCKIEGCSKRPSFGVAGTRMVEYCAQHAQDGMVDVCNRKCRIESCGKHLSFGVTGTRAAEYFAHHAKNEMVDLNIICAHRGCNKHAPFGVAGTKQMGYCTQHTRPGRGAEGYRRQDIGPHHFGKETIGNASRKTENRSPSPRPGTPSIGW